MYIEKTVIPEVCVVTPKLFNDERGWFMESFSEKTLEKNSIRFKAVQINHICSDKKGILRGIHFQNNPCSQAKLLRCVSGRVMDYAIDLRKDSPTYKQYVCVELTAENKKQLFIPHGFGHAVVSLSNYSEIEYLVDDFYNPQSDRSIYYADPELNIVWPEGNIIISDKDRNAPLLSKSDCNF